MSLRRSLSLTAVTLAFGAVARAQTAGPAIGVIDGMVTDSSLVPIEGASVNILQTAVRVETGTSGHFRVVKMPAGQYLVIVRCVGFRPVSGVIQVSANDTVRLAYTLERAAVGLDTIKVTEQRLTMRMAEFEARRRLGDGQFLTQEQIDRRNVGLVSDLIRPFLGLFVATSTGTIPAHYAASTRTGTCLTQVFLDGVKLPNPTNLDLLPSPKELAGIEFYTGPGRAPIQYGGFDAMCGVLLLWTKDGSG